MVPYSVEMSRTKSELSLGNKNDNVFVQRANEISKADLGIVYEVDDSTPNDL